MGSAAVGSGRERAGSGPSGTREVGAARGHRSVAAEPRRVGVAERSCRRGSSRSFRAFDILNRRSSPSGRRVTPRTVDVLVGGRLVGCPRDRDGSRADFTLRGRWLEHRRGVLLASRGEFWGWRVGRLEGDALGGSRGRGRARRRLEHGASRDRRRVRGFIRAARVPVRVVPRGYERGRLRRGCPRRVAHRGAGCPGRRGCSFGRGFSRRRGLRDADEPRALRLAEPALDPLREVHRRACVAYVRVGRSIGQLRGPRFEIGGSTGGVSRGDGVGAHPPRSTSAIHTPPRAAGAAEDLSPQPPRLPWAPSRRALTGAIFKR